MLFSIIGTIILALGIVYIHTMRHCKIRSRTKTIESKIVDKKMDMIPVYFNYDYPNIENTYTQPIFLIKASDLNEYIVVEEDEFKSYFIGESVDLIVITNYYINYNLFSKNDNSEEIKYTITRRRNGTTTTYQI